MTEDAPYIHPSSVVDEPVQIGFGTKVWHFCHLCAGARIGRNVSIGQNAYIASSAIVGDGCRIQNNVSLYDGVELEADVFIGPSVVFTNVTNPRAAISRRSEFKRTRVGVGATLGANATIVPGIVLGAYCFVAAGAVVTKDVPAYALVAGVPARQVGWVSEEGNRLSHDESESNRFVCVSTGKYYRVTQSGLVPIGAANPTAEAPDITPH